MILYYAQEKNVSVVLLWLTLTSGGTKKGNLSVKRGEQFQTTCLPRGGAGWNLTDFSWMTWNTKTSIMCGKKLPCFLGGGESKEVRRSEFFGGVLKAGDPKARQKELKKERGGLIRILRSDLIAERGGAKFGKDAHTSVLPLKDPFDGPRFEWG